ncbi:hypothetical protein R5W24_000790 [Gemmata sp. JC717]|uniref:hypothetical protein n=1 Tax=Gemmata algarum TaxID=2975278 RepID=UPI0021BA5D55|nr:hypothetical protein [Gemmata algarum]MDY3551711.1 hypothetical protein [Gemmata algarum]
MTDLFDTWDRIHRRPAAHAPDVPAGLALPAPDEQFRQVGSRSGTSVPERGHVGRVIH